MKNKIIFAISCTIIAILLALIISCETFQKVDYRVDKQFGDYNIENTVKYK